MKKILIFFTIILISGEACIEPIDLKINSMAGKLVVDGLVTNQPESYRVTLSRSLAFNSDRLPAVYLVPETNAAVSIKDGDGNVYILSEVESGIYETNYAAFVGEVGNSYQLNINTSDGKSYESVPEEMPTIPAIDSILYKYQIRERLITNSQGHPVVVNEYGFLISVIVNDPVDQRNYYRWKSNGIFEFFSITDNPEIKQCWAPLFRLESAIVIGDDRHFNGNPFNQDVTTILYDRETKFLARIEQMSLTQKAFEFWDEISKQLTSTGSIFDPAPARVMGNLYNPDDKDEFVLGYFGASAIYKDSVLIDRFKASGYVSASPQKPPLLGDCRTMEPYATNIKPPGFK